MMAGGFPQMNGMAGAMDMNPLGMAGMANPLLLQEMMMNQMALMAQMASTMGMLGNPAAQFGAAPGFPMQGVMPGDVGMFPGAGMNGFSNQQQQQHMNGRGRGGGGGGHGGRNMGQSRGAPSSPVPNMIEAATSPSEHPATAAAVAPIAPIPVAAVNTVPPSTASTSVTHVRPGLPLPERPQSPTLCKFGLKCTNAQCRWSHPSPVATAESGMVLSNEACEDGKDCKDKDCIKAHVSPAVLTAAG
jgi:hypothetical protein